MKRIFELVDHVYVINLPDRRDRRRQMSRQLHSKRLALRAEDLSKVEFFPATRPADRAGFASIGLRGASLSHLDVLRNARSRGFSSILVLEDDATFHVADARHVADVATQLKSTEWGLVQLGYGLPPMTSSPSAGATPFRAYEGDLLGAHCYVVGDAALERLIVLFETQHSGVSGDDTFGPMSPDGTLNVFARLNSDLPRLIPVPSLADQGSSRSDITAGRFDNRPVLGVLLSIARRAKRRMQLRR